MPELDDELIVVRQRLIEELHRLAIEIDTLRGRCQGIQTTIEGLDEVLGIEHVRPKGAEAVAIVAMDAIQAGADHDADWALTVPQIVDALRARGWLPDSEKPEAAVRAAITRLRKSDPRWGLLHGRLYYHDRPGVPSDDDLAESEQSVLLDALQKAQEDASG